MAYRPLWQLIRAQVYNFVTSAFRTQAQIDTFNDNFMADYGTVVTNPTSLPSNVKRRRQVFFSPSDALIYVDEGGIPADYVYFLKVPNYRSRGDTAYFVYIQTG